MKKEEQLSLGYDFEFQGDYNNTYIFETDYKVLYDVKFKPSFYLFEESSPFSRFAYELVIAVVEQPNDKVPSDPLIAFTIAAIVKNFFQFKERIILYICETSDRRHKARYRKFSAWFDEFNDKTLLKIESMIPDKDGITYFNALIIRRDNPEKERIIEAFKKLSGDYSEEK